MRYLIYGLYLFTLPLWSDTSKDAYFKYLEQYPFLSSSLGHADQGEIEIVLDKEKISAIEQQRQRKVGVIAEDTYWLWINDAVKFPSGSYGVYGRILQKQIFKNNFVGVAVLPLLSDGRIALNRNFRHATRSWEYELPRGGANPEESIEEAAKRELKEETGFVVNSIHLLGHMSVDSGLTSTIVPIVVAKVSYQEDSQPEDSEAIESIDLFTLEEIKKGFVNGYLSIIKGEKEVKIPLRDSFLAFALLQAQLQKLF